MHQKFVTSLFNAIAPHYDRINRILSCGIDLYWRRCVTHSFLPHHTGRLLDMATGTGDQLLHTLQKGPFTQGVGLDLSEEMLKIAQQKGTQCLFKDTIEWQQGDALALPFENNAFDGMTLSFGLRNIPDTKKALEEFHRVLKPGAPLRILEFSLPQHSAIRVPYLWYLRSILPRLGRILSSNPVAYTYLNQTIETFPYGEALAKLIRGAKFQEVKCQPLTFGIATLYSAMKGPT